MRPRVTEQVVHRLDREELDPDHEKPLSPFAAQVVNWQRIRKQQEFARMEYSIFARRAMHAPERSGNPAPYWP